MADTQDFNHTQISVPDTITRNGTEQDASPFAQLVAYFEREHNGRFLVDPAKHGIRWVFAGDHGTYTLVVYWDDKAKRVITRVPQIATVPPDKLDAAAVLINLINWQLVFGTFQLDSEDGELALRSNLVVEDGRLGQEQLAAHFLASALAVDHFMPAFQRLLWSDASPEEALASLA